MLTPAELDRVRVVLVRTRNPLNMGAVARAMSNFGLQHLRVVQPYEAAFREAQSAVGAEDLLAHAEEYSRVADAVADCTLVAGTTAVGEREVLHPLHTLEVGARIVREQLVNPEGRVAILFGSEKTGLSNDDLSYCHHLLRIPTCTEHRSMNLGQAAAVCFYELIRDSSGATEASAERTVAQSAALERMADVLMDALQKAGYTQPAARDATEQRVRRMLRRMQMESSDAEEWLGMLRKVVWKLENGS